VKLIRVFGFGDEEDLDPFLLLDEFGSTRAEDYLAGFPWHPHRGMETVTWLLEGSVRHGDSLGSGGVIGPGELQWMTAGSGIIHEEMPLRSPKGVRGLQLWVNLPRAEKMCDPAYRAAGPAQVPEVAVPGGRVRILAGAFGGARGPVSDIARSPVYLDVVLDAGASMAIETPGAHTAFAYVLEGGLGGATAGDCVLLGAGDLARFEAGSLGARFAFIHAEPLREPVAWRGPIVMNTEEELDLAFREYREGSFVRKGATPGQAGRA
jgi:redox-sensitive bicupin YhaK (pirin superfamily)